MIYTLQLRDARASTISKVAGKCADSAAFAELVNEAQRRLMRKGGWWGTEFLMQVCAFDRLITWPYFVGTVLGVRPCGQMGAMMRNQWWNVVGPANCMGIYWGNWQGGVTIVDETPAPCYNEIAGNEGRYIRYCVVKNQDYGKTITLFGFKFGGQPLQQLDGNNVWQMGLTITAAQPYAQTTELITKITSVVREQTQGMTYLYEVDTLGVLRDIAQYQPNETNPIYRRSLIQGFCSIPYFTDAYERKVRKLEALVKLEFFPAEKDEDFLCIGNLDAIKLAIQAIRFEESQDYNQANAAWSSAVHELNLELRDRFPNNQTAIVVNAISGDYPIVSAY